MSIDNKMTRIVVAILTQDSAPVDVGTPMAPEIVYAPELDGPFIAADIVRGVEMYATSVSDAEQCMDGLVCFLRPFVGTERIPDPPDMTMTHPDSLHAERLGQIRSLAMRWIKLLPRAEALGLSDLVRDLKLIKGDNHNE